MKKFLIGVILIIPIIVVFALNTAGSLIALSVKVNPTQLVLKTVDNEEIAHNARFEIDTLGEEMILVVEVYPSIAADKSVVWESDPSLGGKVRLERIGESNRYRVIPEKTGVARLTVRAAANINLYQSITFFIASEIIERIELYDGNGTVIGGEYALNSASRIFYDIQPIDALAGNAVRWESTDPDVFTVTQNGTLYPVSRGIATLKLTATDRTGKNHLKRIQIDTSAAVVRTDAVYAVEEVDETWLRQNVLLTQDIELEKINENNWNVIDQYGNRYPLRVDRCAPGEWGFTDTLDVIYTQNGPYFLEVDYLETVATEEYPPLDYSLRITNLTGAARLVENEIIPVKAGTVEVTAAVGEVEKTRTVIIRERPVYFDLDLGKEDAALGIRMTRLWGRYWLDQNNALTDTFRLGSPDLDASQFDLYWETDRPECVDLSVDPLTQEAILRFKEEAAGQDITIKATVQVNKYLTGVSQQFTFRIDDDPQAVNVYDFNQLQTAAGMHRSVVLQNDIASDATTVLYNDLYGNGFTISTAHRSGLNRFDCILSLKKWQVTDFSALPEAVEISDVVLEGGASYETAQGTGIGFDDLEVELTVSNVIARYFIRCIEAQRLPKLVVEGSILGYSVTSGIFVTHNSDADQHEVILRNNVLTMTREGPAVLFATSYVNEQNNNKNILPKVKIEGFLDIYNWKAPEETRTAFAGLLMEYAGDLAGSGIDPQQLVEVLGKVLEGFLQNERFNSLYYDYNGTKYMSLGVMALGLMNINDPSNITIEAPDLKLLKMPLKDVGGLVGSLIDMINEIAQIEAGMSINNPCYFVCPDFSSGPPPIEPGDAVPQDEALYEKLRQGIVG